MAPGVSIGRSNRIRHDLIQLRMAWIVSQNKLHTKSHCLLDLEFIKYWPKIVTYIFFHLQIHCSVLWRNDSRRSARLCAYDASNRSALLWFDVYDKFFNILFSPRSVTKVTKPTPLAPPHPSSGLIKRGKWELGAICSVFRSLHHILGLIQEPSESTTKP